MESTCTCSKCSWHQPINERSGLCCHPNDDEVGTLIGKPVRTHEVRICFHYSDKNSSFSNWLDVLQHIRSVVELSMEESRKFNDTRGAEHMELVIEGIDQAVHHWRAAVDEWQADIDSK